MTPLVTIIVPARNAARTIGLLLDDVAAMRLDVADIVVVDDGSDDSTAAVVLERAHRFGHLRLIPGPGRGPAAARNAGAAVATTPWLAFVDADVRLPEDWLDRGLEATSGDADVVEGTVVPRGGDADGLIRHWALTEGGGVFVTANLWVRTDAFHRVGGFDEGYVAPWREDTDFGWRLVAAGARAETCSELVAFHPFYRRPVTSLLHAGPKILADTRLRSKFPEKARRLQPRREMRRAYVSVTLLLAGAVTLVWPAPLVAGMLGLGAELAAVAAVLPMAAHRGPTGLREWATLVLLAPFICLSRVYWVVRSNLAYRIRFW